MLTKIFGKTQAFEAPNWRSAAAAPLKLLEQGALKAKPGLNLVLGCNGAGKTAVLRYLAAMFSADCYGYSRLSKAVGEREAEKFFPGVDRWDWEKSLVDVYPHLGVSLRAKSRVEGAFYWTPGFIPGYHSDLTHSLMCGYTEDSRRLHKLLEGKSSGQASMAVLDEVLGHLEGGTRPEGWRGMCSIPKDPSYCFERRQVLAAAHAKKLWNAGSEVVPGSTVVVILDEPDQSLDQVGQLEFWQRLDRICKEHKNVQMLVSTHSFAPLLLLASKEIEAHVVQTSNYMESSTLLSRVGVR